MSEESPWGAPPPSGNPPGYGQPHPSYLPPGSPAGPPPPGWGAPPTVFGGPPLGPPNQPPRRSNLAAIIGIVLAIVLVIAAVTVTLIVTSGDDDPQSADDSPSATDTTDTTETSSDDATATTSSAGEITGDGYSYDLPGPAWNDAYDEASASGVGSTLDTIIILGTSIDLAQSNILVEALSAGGATDVDQIAEQWKRNLSGTDGAVPDPIDDITIDGERAIGVKFTKRTNENGVDIDQICYLVLHGGNQYSLALSYPSDGDSVSEDDFSKVLDSWTWSS